VDECWSQVDPHSRRNSISSVGTVCTGPIAKDTSTLGINENTMLIRPELHQLHTPVFQSPSSNGHYSPIFNKLSKPSNMFASTSNVNCDMNVEEMFELIKEYCSQNALLFKNLMDWCIASNPASQISKDEAKYLSEGRF